MDDARPWQGLAPSADRQVQEAFNYMVHWQLGAGNQILFWKDRRLNGSSVSEIAHDIWKLVRTHYQPQIGPGGTAQSPQGE